MKKVDEAKFFDELKGYETFEGIHRLFFTA